MTKPRIIVVLGMHRSGTSAIARGLKTLSVELGDNLMPAAPDNERGFWEDMDIYRFNEKLFSKLGSAWNRMAPTETNRLTSDEFAAERYAAIALLENKISKSPVFGFKDPRTSILLPFWQCIFGDMGVQDSYVMAVRNPLEVAESLRKRGQAETSAAMLLWLKYNWAAVENSTGRPRVSLSYSTLIEQPAEQLARIARALNLPHPAPSSPAMFEYVSEFLSKDLVHNRISNNEIKRSKNIPPPVKTLYELLLQWAAEEGADFEVPTKAKVQIESYFVASRSLLQLGDSLYGEIAAKENANSGLMTSLEQAKSDLSERAQRIANLEAAETTAKHEISDLKAKLQATEDILFERAQRIAILEATETTSKNEIIDLNGRLRNNATSLCQREHRIADLEKLLHESTEMLRVAREEAKQEKEVADDRYSLISLQLKDANLQFQALKRTLAEALEATQSKDAEVLKIQQKLETQARENKQVAESLQSTQSLAEKLKQTEVELKKCADILRKKQEELSQSQQLAASTLKNYTTLQMEVADKTTTVRLLRHEVRALRSSTSWKITKPFRLLRTIPSRVKQAIIPPTKSPDKSPPHGVA